MASCIAADQTNFNKNSKNSSVSEREPESMEEATAAKVKEEKGEDGEKRVEEDMMEKKEEEVVLDEAKAKDERLSQHDEEAEKEVFLTERQLAMALTKSSAIEKYFSTCMLDEEDEARFADFDSELPDFLSRTLFSQDAKFFFLIFTAFLFFSVLILFMIQANCAWHNNQLLELLGHEDFSQDFFYLHYYEMPERRASPGLRVNTSCFVH